jgi:hypothetical protein
MNKINLTPFGLLAGFVQKWGLEKLLETMVKIAEAQYNHDKKERHQRLVEDLGDMLNRYLMQKMIDGDSENE